MSENPVEYTTIVEKSRTNVAQVTDRDATAELLAAWREKMPRVMTVEAYLEAVKLSDAVLRELERFEKSGAFKRLTGAQ